MGSSQFGKSDVGFFGDFFRDYKNRMEAVAPFEAGIEAEGLDFPGRDEIRQKYQDYRQSGGSSLSQAARDLVEAYIPYRDRVAKELSQRGFPDIQSGLEDFERKTGVVDYSEPGSVPTYDYEQPLHELLSHQRPYELGMAPDYRDFYAGTDPEGNPVNIKSNTITPINEDLATDLDVQRSRGLRGKELSPKLDSITKGGFTDLLMSELNNRNVLDEDSLRLLPTRMELQYPTRTSATGTEVFPSTEQVDADVARSAELLKDKYAKPMNQRLAGLLATQFPGIKTNVSGLNDIEDLLSLVEQYEGKPTNRSQYFYGTLLPGVTPETITRMAGDIRRTPSSLLPGVADLIPSAKAVRLGYEKDPAAMGKQMARDFAAGIPLSAAITPILANPYIAPFAPGIGAGLLGVAGSEAVNEVVKQETGKSLLQRFQETMGAAGGDTTTIGKARRPVPDKKFVPDNRPYETPQITQMSPADVSRMEVERKAKQNENEFQRRVRLAKEARQLDPFDFGITEMLFGR
jgi:hypothetical protein